MTYRYAAEHAHLSFRNCVISFAIAVLAGCVGELPTSQNESGANGNGGSDAAASDGAVGDADMPGPDSGDSGADGGDGGNSPDAAPPSDAGEGGTVEDDASTPPTGVEAFVAAGYGGSTVLSCDQGRTWIAHQQISDTDDEHDPWTPKGLAYARGVFVFYTGWGSEGVARWSTDGINWTPVDLPTWYGGVGVTGDEFVIMGGAGVLTSQDGKTWIADASIPKTSPQRQTDAFDDLWVASEDTAHAVAKPGQEWTTVSANCSAFVGGIGQRGGWAAGNGRAVVTGNHGVTCAFDLSDGSPLGEGSLGVDDGGKPFFTGQDFIVAAGSQLHRSVDGVTWTHHDLPNGVSIDLVARSASGTYVGVRRLDPLFYYSDDGEDWSQATAPETLRLTYLEFGYVEASAACPAP